jgi:hypothetical protein
MEFAVSLLGVLTAPENIKCSNVSILLFLYYFYYKGADKSLARPVRKQATATEDFEFHISYL